MLDNYITEYDLEDLQVIKLFKTTGPVFTNFRVHHVHEKKVTCDMLKVMCSDCNHDKLILACVRLKRLFCGKSHGKYRSSSCMSEF